MDGESMSREPRRSDDHTLKILGSFAVFFGLMSLIMLMFGIPFIVVMLPLIITVVFVLYFLAAVIL